MFPLHPLTVEDVLQQDPTEKVDVFDRLGYYFLVLRAIDERYFKYTSASASTLGLNLPGSVASSSPPQMKEKSEGLSEEVRGSPTSGNLNEKRSRKLSTHREESFEMKDLSSGSSDNTQTASREKKGLQDFSDEKLGEGSPDLPQKREGKARVDIIDGVNGKEGIEGVSVGAVNLYLIVFAHGVISVSNKLTQCRETRSSWQCKLTLCIFDFDFLYSKFHFEDVTKHTDRVRKKLLQLSQPVEFTSDWVAHGLLDSVVDSFAPLVEYVESEAVELERLAQEPMPDWQRGRKKKSKQKEKEKEKTIKTQKLQSITPKPSFFFRLFKKSSPASSQDQAEVEGTAQIQSKMLRRMTNSRKIITGLSRVLAPKNDSVRGLRKRLLEARVPSLSRDEVSIYMGDVHDHIVTMLTLLYNSENRLSDTHHAYLALIGINNRRVRERTDETILLLVSVTITAVWATWFCSVSRRRSRF